MGPLNHQNINGFNQSISEGEDNSNYYLDAQNDLAEGSSFISANIAAGQDAHGLGSPIQSRRYQAHNGSSYQTEDKKKRFKESSNAKMKANDAIELN